MRPAILRDLGIIGVLIALGIGLAVYAPRDTRTLAGSTVKVMVGQGHGSAVHIGGGYLISAAHVTQGKAVRIKLDDQTEHDAEVLWENTAYDIALLKTDAKLASSALDCRVAGEGEAINARGNPLSLEFVNSSGRIAGKELPIGPWKRVLPVDMTLVMGMSGGPSFAADGRVIGINVGGVVAPIGFSPSLTGFGFIVPASAICGLGLNIAAR
jgi:S1-C subfamily serine protease